ncbi:glycerophosphodiester phosphodiesterase [Brevibacillus sp. SYSU BS000544]|uniref:glycerophosphodiester phosphodiesterase n=1 Tax=Brevibacillus sp. SYSU BS000544 TaxID=3416443 RepID=UPI003CE4C641
MGNPCIAHRGWSGKAPENTLAAIVKALNHPQIDGIEIDVQLSKDGIPVIIHDFTLERTTSGRGKVGDQTYADLEKLEAGSWFSREYAEEKIPSLEQVLIAGKGKKTINLELKKAGNLYPQLEEIVIELVRKHGMQDQIVLTSFDHFSVQKAKALAPEIKAGPIISGNLVLLQEQLKAMQADLVSMDHEFLTSERVEQLFDSQIDLMVWTVNHPHQMQEIRSLSDQVWICTNHPDQWFTLLS